MPSAVVAPTIQCSQPQLQSMLQELANWTADAINGSQKPISPGLNMTHTDNDDGVVMHAHPDPETRYIPPRGAPVITNPFTISISQNLVDGIWDNTYNVTIYVGTVCLIVPTNIFAVINLAISSTQYVVLTCNADAYAMTSSTWGVQSSAPAPVDASAEAPPPTFYVVLGILYVDPTTSAVLPYQIVSTNILASPAEWTRTTRPGAGAFDLAYQIYYYWNVTQPPSS
jgi:hypothetical protein